MNTSFSQQMTVQIQPFDLEPYYENDLWDLTQHPQFEELTANQKALIKNRNHVVDFTTCENLIIKNELKYYCQNFIEVERKKLSYFATLVGGICVIIRFLNTHYSKNESVLDKPYDGIVEIYKRYLQENGYKLHVTAKNALTEQMQSREYHHPTPYVRFFQNFYKFIEGNIKKKSEEKKNIFEMDKWDIRDLPFQVKGFNPSRPRYTISFEKIQQDGIKKITKQFIFQRLKNKTYATCIDDLKGIVYLSNFLKTNYPEVTSLKQLNRFIIEDFLGDISLNDSLKPRTKQSRIGSVKTFFDTCMLYGWEEAPLQTLILSDDAKKKSKFLPRYYEDEVLYQINQNLENLPVQIARMVFVIQNVGMRISELCQLKIDCLKQDSEEDYVLEYYQQKTKEINRVPIKEDVALAIKEAIKYSKEQFGDNIKYVFMQNEHKPISPDTFSYHMNRLIKKHNIRNRNGELARIKSHLFRGTVATRYANMGMNMNLIRILLGQRSVGAIRYYVEILEETISESMKNILHFQDQMIQNIGKKDVVIQMKQEDIVEIPLSNGSCAKLLSSGKCLHANACYTCAMFKPDPKSLDIFKRQLVEAKSNIEMAKINGFERIQQINEDLATNLERIINMIEKGGVQM